MFESYPDIMSVKQLASALGIGLNNAYDLIRTNQIKSKKVGRKYLIPKRCIFDFMEIPHYANGNQGIDYLSKDKEETK